jgi:chromosomal replication initiation ATPase DnaA
MLETLAEEVLQRIEQVRLQYHRLVILAAPTGKGKTRILQIVQQKTQAPLININLALSRLMLDLTEKQRALKIALLLGEAVDYKESELVLLDNTEMLFAKAFRTDPLRLLQTLARSKTVVASWNGEIKDDWLYYATPEHPEYRRYPIKELCLVGVV